VAPASVEAVLEALPQTQCRRCGYDDCRSYARAIADDGIEINRCPPGGAEGVLRLARVTGRPALPLDPSCGSEAPRARARVDEDWCIGCALCLKACPVDAIVGAAKQMHVVIEPLCTGCELCLPVCPVDCIEMEAVSGERTGWHAWSPALAQQARGRYAAHATRSGVEAVEPDAAGEPAPREPLADVLARARQARARG
jgi:electron transport complex protein RnfB